MLNIYELIYPDGEKEWFTGITAINALSNYLKETNQELWDIENCDIIELPKEKWDEFLVREEGCFPITFAAWMETNGDYPGLIAGTIYD
jgi:hypothetical protein